MVDDNLTPKSFLRSALRVGGLLVGFTVGFAGSFTAHRWVWSWLLVGIGVMILGYQAYTADRESGFGRANYWTRIVLILGMISLAVFLAL